MPDEKFIVGDVCRVEEWPDIGRFDVIVAGEILEHLDRPTDALRGLGELLNDDGVLIVTVPNAFSLKGTMRAFLRTEIVHKDHVAYYSGSVLASAAERAGISIDRVIGYITHPKSLLKRVLSMPFNLMIRMSPNLADGLVAEFTRKK